MPKIQMNRTTLIPNIPCGSIRLLYDLIRYPDETIEPITMLWSVSFVNPMLLCYNYRNKERKTKKRLSLSDKKG
jgi:hypothetical protein